MWEDDATGQSALDYLKGCDPDMSEYKINQMTRFFVIFIGICLIGNDPEIVERQVLSKDLIKLKDDNHERLAEKAKKRGKFGFSFGAMLEKKSRIYVALTPVGSPVDQDVSTEN
jgi:hypothetical protein